MNKRVVIVPRHLLPGGYCLVWEGMPEPEPEHVAEVSVSQEGLINAIYNVQMGPEFCLEWENE